ncbi:MAG TPA: M3 family oligoendopeptidase [Anaerolineae bacterium]
MFETLPTTAHEFMEWPWSRIAPYYEELAQRPLTAANVAGWLSDWSRLARLMHERFARLNVATTVDTTDEAAERQYNDFLENIFPADEAAQQRLKEKLLASDLEPDGMAVPLRKMRADAELFVEANLPLLAEERKLGNAYNKIIGAQTVEWEGKEKTLTQLNPYFQTSDRAVRERIWRLSSTRQLADRPAINDLWVQLAQLRQRLADNAGFDNYRAYRWQQLKRFDYTPADSQAFHDAIEQVVVPAAGRVYQRLRQNLGVDRLRPWDVQADVFPMSLPALKPFDNVAELDERAAAIFHRVDPELGAYFDIMRRENLLDLPNRPGKAPGGYCTYFDTAQRPFIFMNAVGTAGDVRTMLHEAGHAFHSFEAGRLPYVQQRHPGAEFAEVASMAMELLAAPYLAAGEGGYYADTADAARHRANHLQRIITFWPYMAVVDAFQHWAYQNPEAALNPDNCDACWSELWQRFIPAIEWSGLEAEMMTGWQRKLHIFRFPFYYVEYGMAQVGAIQVWRNALSDQAEAVFRYRQALALGGTLSLPQLYQAAGGRFSFDVPTMQAAVSLLEETIADLETV